MIELIFLISVIIIIFFIISKKNKGIKFILKLLFIINFSFLFTTIILFTFYPGSIIREESYKQGQLDYHNGIIKVELKMLPDSTVIWEFKK